MAENSRRENSITMLVFRFQVFLIALLGVFFCFPTTEAHPRSVIPEPTKPTILIVSGVSHTPKHFEPIQTIFENSGYSVHNPRLPSNALLPPTHSHQRDVDTIRGIAEQLTAEGKRIIVLMHSYGGFVGTNALYDLGLEQREKQGLHGGVEWLAYMATLLPMAGETVADLLQLDSGLSLERRVDGSSDTRNKTSRVLLPPLNPEAVFYGDLAPEAQEWAVAELTGVSSDAFSQSLQNESWRYIKTGYLACKLDQSVPVRLQDEMVERVRERGVHVQQKTINSSHSPYLSQPQTVIDWIEELQN